jgi:hypothetical protein
MDHLRHAVTDGPDGSAAVALPSIRAAALRMKAFYGRGFWCSSAIGGCGAMLIVAAGKMRVPHFRHKPGERGECALELDPRRADAIYRHLALQRALVEWINAQGHDAQIEYPVAGGRADVHVVIDSRRHSLEVQLSPITGAEWKRRDNLYRNQIEDVTWLFGDALDTRATEDLLRHDVSFHIHVDSDLEVALGTRFVDDHIAWDELQYCRLTSGGLWTPHSATAVAMAQRWRRLTAVVEALHAEVQRREKEEAAARQRRREESAARRRLAASQQMPLMRRPQSTKPVRLPSVGHYPWTREARAALSDEADGWTPTTGWGWLNDVPLDLQPSARLLAYYVCRIYSAGPVKQLSFDDVPDPDGYQVDALVAAGLITVYEVSGVRRWRRQDV